MAADQDIIDLTEELSDLGIPSPSISSAKKRPPPRLDFEPAPKRGAIKEKLRLLGRSFAVDRFEKHYRAVQIGDMVIEVDSMITSDLGQALVRRIVKGRRIDGKVEILCHVHWLHKSACGTKNEVFLKHGDCDDIKPNTVKSVEPIYIGSQGPSPNRHLLRHVYQHSYNVWRDPKLVDTEGRPVCDSCCSSKERQPREEYHLFDSIFVEESSITPGSTLLMWRVARIIQVDSDSVKVQLFERFSDRAKAIATRGLSTEYVSERRLLLSRVFHRIPLSKILGKANVGHDEIPLHEVDSGSTPQFYCQEGITENGEIKTFDKPLVTCISCSNSTADLQKEYRQFCQKVDLPAIDYYSGGGGGMIGARGFFRHAHAVEMDDTAYQTLRENFRRTRIHCQKVGDASDAARRQLGGLPESGTMVLASAGPPCQGHSGANHQNKVEDDRNNELFVTIDEIKRLKPDIFILENVPGMKRDRVEDNNSEGINNFAVAGIKRLRDIGYQNRIRLFLICARMGVTLPTTPQPTHANPELKMNIFTSASNSTRWFYVGDKGTCGSGPLPAITVRDAISDLPKFEYKYDGHNAHRKSSIPLFDPLKAAGTRVGFHQPAPYHTPASNDFQARQRDGSEKVENQYTPPRTPRILELVFTSDAYVGQRTPSETPGHCRRINPDAGALTLLTDSAPGGKSSGTIHYDQRRTLTVAERKRLQGVPDKYHIVGNVEDKDRQVGNMINVNLSRALHAHIHREVFFKAWLEMGKPDNFLERWRDQHPI